MFMIMITSIIIISADVATTGDFIKSLKFIFLPLLNFDQLKH